MLDSRPRRLFALLLVGVAAYRFSLLGRGALAFVDETFYFTSVNALRSMSEGDVAGVVGGLSMARGRVGAAILEMPIAALQWIPAHFGVAASNLHSLLIPTTFNVVVTLFSLYFVFAIGVVLAGSEAAALAGAFVYALLVNSNLYVRLVPYDWALCAGLLALWLAVTRPTVRGLALWTGLLTAATLTIYTGYYSFCAVIGVAILWERWSSALRRDAVRSAIVIGASAVLVVAAIEALFYAGGSSCLGNLRDVRRDIAFTSFGDGWTFLAQYLLDVEWLAGVALILGAATYAWRAGVRLWRGAMRPIDRVVLPMFAAFIAQAVSSAHLHMIPLFGRLIHPWMPFSRGRSPIRSRPSHPADCAQPRMPASSLRACSRLL
jgi:hypothetical protein